MKKITSTLTAILLIGSLAVSAAASSASVFTPSVERQGRAIVTEDVTDNLSTSLGIDLTEHPEAAATIVSPTGEVLAAPTAEEIAVTSLAALAAVSDGSEAEVAPEIKAMLEEARTELETVETLAEICPELEDFAKAIDPAYTAADLVVSEVFDITIPDEFLEILNANEETYLGINVEYNVETSGGIAPAVIYKCPGEDWAMLPKDSVIINADGTLTLKFHRLCPIAFVTDANVLSAVDPSVKSPTTAAYEEKAVGVVPAIIIFAALTGVTGIMVLRRKKV